MKLKKIIVLSMTLAFTMNFMSAPVYSADISESSETVAESKITTEDFEATKAHILNSSNYSGNGKVTDVNGNGIIDVFDLIRANHQFPDNISIELNDFKANVWDIYINTDETVRFTVDVKSDLALPKNTVSLYNENDGFVSYMYDDGTNGDETANDGVYSTEVTISSPKTGNKGYYAAATSLKSKTYEIGFYKDITEDDVNSFTKIVSDIAQMSFEDAFEYIKNSDEILKYQTDVDTHTILYQTVYGFTTIWENPSLKIDESDSEKPNSCGKGEFAIDDEQMKPNNDHDATVGRNITTASEKIDKYKFQPSKHENCNAAVLKQTKFNDNYENIGNCIVQALNQQTTASQKEIKDSKLYIMDPELIDTYEACKHLENYDTVILDAHGTSGLDESNTYIETGIRINSNDLISIDTIMNINPITKFEDEFITYAMAHSSFVPDLYDGSILLFPAETGYYANDWKWEIAIGSRYFDKYYNEGDLDGAIWILANCRSMKYDDISDVLINKGAETVIGYSDIVCSWYRDETLFEILVNSMILSADTVEHGIEEARRLYGECDPYNCKIEYKFEKPNHQAEIMIKGNKDYKFINKIELKEANSDTDTNDSKDNEEPGFLFGERVYPMQGGLSICFPPVNAGTNYDNRTLDIIKKLYTKLVDGDKAIYMAYSGNAGIGLWPKHQFGYYTYGVYESLDEIVNFAESTDNVISYSFHGNVTNFSVGVYDEYDYYDKAENQGTSWKDYLCSEFTENNDKFNLFIPLSLINNIYYQSTGKAAKKDNNKTTITIIKDDYYYDVYKGKTHFDYTRDDYEYNYLKNYKEAAEQGVPINSLNALGAHNYVNRIYYFIDLRDGYDDNLEKLCRNSGGKYIKYSEDSNQLDNLIELINARREIWE